MRYLNWDVLLFPEQSRVPLREFKTTCHITYDAESMQDHASAPPHLAANPVNQRQLPIITCFVPNLPHGCPFRVSLHSWHEPEISRATQALTSPEECVLFEARVFLDGEYVSGLLLNNLGPWPQVIDTCSSLSSKIIIKYRKYRADMRTEFDKIGNQECLRFPPFHQEMLMNNWWSAGEDLGRVRVVITEGFTCSKGQPTAFRRVKNVVSFSFQHAPLAVLEDAGIAWPNAGMWHQATQQLYAPPSPCLIGAVDPDAHAHSPRRRHVFKELNGDTTAAVIPPRLLSQTTTGPPATQRSTMMNHANWAALPLIQDHQNRSNEGHKHQMPRRLPTCISISDDSMPDCSYSKTPRSSRDPSLHNIQILHERPAVQHDSQFEELMAAYSPAKPSGTQAPPSTRVSSRTNSPPTTLKTSDGPEVRIRSHHGQSRVVSVTTRDTLPSSARAQSDISMESRFSESQNGDKGKGGPKIKTIPATEIKGRKEGKNNELESSKSTGEGNMLTPSTRPYEGNTANKRGDRSASAKDSKRKRASLGSVMNNAFEYSEGPQSSPSKKASKRGRKDVPSDPADSPKSPESVIRAPLSSLQNIQ